MGKKDRPGDKFDINPHKPTSRVARQTLVPGKISGMSLTLICLLLILATVIVYGQTFHFGFVQYDDGPFVYENPMVKAGLSQSTVAWAFTTLDYQSWQPLTTLSYLTDSQLFGLNPGAEHAINVVFHILATILLFFAFFRMTAQPWRSAFIACVFAIHPLHVESVAWISERKDVLSTFFEMLCLLLYVRYVQAPATMRYFLMALAFACSLMSKPMGVTFPVILLLLDFWPLRRFTWRSDQFPGVAKLMLEKLPLAAMSIGIGVITLIWQNKAGAVVSADRIGWSTRLANVPVSYARYIWKALWPGNLAVLYPFQHPAPAETLLSLVFILGISSIALRTSTRRPSFFVGWFWFVCTLVPVIGLVQVGNQGMADRYMYVPLIGLSLIVVWPAMDVIEGFPAWRNAVSIACIGWLLIMGVTAFKTAGYWQDSQTLFAHALGVTENNDVMATSLGLVLQAEGRNSEASGLYRQALKSNTGNQIAKNNLGTLLEREGQYAEALKLYREAVALDPSYAMAQQNLGARLLQAGEQQEAVLHLLEAVRLSPQSATAHGILGIALCAQGRLSEAQQHLERSLDLSPSDATVVNNLCWVLLQRGKPQESIDRCREALRLSPDFVNARLNLANALIAQGDKMQASRELTRLLEQDPGNLEARAAMDRIRHDLDRGATK
jgi:tetratricopeptide (TPR) repeat protein